MRTFLSLLVLAPMLVAQEQRHEVAFTLGHVVAQARAATASPSLDLGSGRALQVNYGFRVAGGSVAALYLGAHFLASPLREVTSANTLATRDFATLYLTPQVTLKFAPGARFSPWGTFGGGYALYEHSTTRIDGQPNAAPRLLHRGALAVGGGLDVRVTRLIAVRGELRNFFTGSPAFNVPVSGGQHNTVAGGGFVLRF